jgi:hypothetical protein
LERGSLPRILFCDASEAGMVSEALITAPRVLPEPGSLFKQSDIRAFVSIRGPV